MRKVTETKTVINTRKNGWVRKIGSDTKNQCKKTEDSRVRGTSL